MDHERPGAHGLRSGERSPEDRVVQRAGGVQLALRDAAPDGVESAISREAPGALTLDDVIAGAWEELSVGGAVGCPVCGGEQMTSRDGGGTPHGDCEDCGTQLY
jgi:hypothetical protein